MFREDAKRFYRELGKKTIEIQKPPDIGEVKKFWQNILEQEISHHEDAQWIKDQQEELKDINQMEWKDLLPKKEETWIPKNYRPIACLPTTFKILTSVITDRLYNHLEKESILTPEQKGGK